MKTIFKKLEYRFFVERTTIENAIFLYKTVQPKATIKTNRMGSTKWTYHKVLSLTTLFLKKINYGMKTSYK